MEVEYRILIQHDSVAVLYDKLVYYKPIFKDKHYIALMIGPLSLWRTVVSHHYAGPSGGHMGKYNTLFLLCMRFYWLGMRKNMI